MADVVHGTHVPISQLIKDLLVRRAFERADRDGREPVLVPAYAPRPVLRGGAAVRLLERESARA